MSPEICVLVSLWGSFLICCLMFDWFMLLAVLCPKSIFSVLWVSLPVPSAAGECKFCWFLVSLYKMLFPGLFGCFLFMFSVH